MRAKRADVTSVRARVHGLKYAHEGVRDADFASWLLTKFAQRVDRSESVESAH